jgi:hypothetical protein
MKNAVIQKILFLERIKSLVLLPDGESISLGLVVEYFEVEDKALSYLIKDNRDDVIFSGYNILKQTIKVI